MIHKIIQFKVHEYAIDTVLGDITKFLKSINESEPETNYASYQLDDQVSFLHVMSFSDEDAENAHRFAFYTTEFVEKLHPNCQEDPVFSGAEIVTTDLT